MALHARSLDGIPRSRLLFLLLPLLLVFLLP
jgi:hypothetical protein